MNKGIIYGGIAAVVIVAITIVLSISSGGYTLDQIIEKKDCEGLMKWEEAHMYDDNLQITSDQREKMTKMVFECAGKAMDNMFGK